MLIPGMQVTSETETIDASKRCRDLFAPYEQDVYVVSHSPDGTLSLHHILSYLVMTSTQHVCSDAGDWESGAWMGYVPALHSRRQRDPQADGVQCDVRCCVDASDNIQNDGYVPHSSS